MTDIQQQWRLLTCPNQRARLITLRTAVSPVLATNYLSHFTDHSVTHSDHLAGLIDELVPTGISSPLSDTEAFVLYAACYLHDVGMQHQRAGVTATMRSELAKSTYGQQQWNDLDIKTRQELVRIHHHRISGEMVRASVDAAHPTDIGFQFRNDEHAGYIASLCVAHCVDTEDQEYHQLTQVGPNIRMPLLSALLRLADILDESRRRTQLFRERTIDLDIVSRMHWWRHYYTADVTFHPATRTINIWFDFPRQRHPEYDRLIPELQMPFLINEFMRHEAVLMTHGIHWRLQKTYTPPTSSSAILMPDEVQSQMMVCLGEQRTARASNERLLKLAHLREFRPLISRRLAAIRETEEKGDASTALKAAAAVSADLWKSDGHREAWISLNSAYNRLHETADLTTSLHVALDIAEMMIADGAHDSAARLLQRIEQQALGFPDPRLTLRWRRSYAESLRRVCAYDLAVTQMTSLIAELTDMKERGQWSAALAEMHLLQGELDHAMAVPVVEHESC